MSWSRYLKATRWYSVWGGLWTEEGEIPTDQLLYQEMVGRSMRKVEGASYLAQANNVFAPGVSRVIRKRPGFSKINATTLNAAGIWTGFVHLGEIADKFYGTASIAAGSHNIYDFASDPPAAVTGGTNFTIAATNLITPLIFTDGTTPGAIFLSRSRDLPQFVVGAGTRSNFTIAGTGLTSLKPAIGEIFTQRALYGDYDQDGTVYDDRVAWSDIRDGNLITDITTQYLSFETRLKDKVRGIRKLSDICVIGKLNNIFTMVPTPEATVPFMVQEEPAGRSRGVVSHNAMDEADHKLFWLGNSNIHSMDQAFQFRDWADAIQPTIRGLNDARREVAVSGVDTDRSLIFFSVSDGSDSTNDDTIALNYKTGQLWIWTTRRNCYGYRQVSDEVRLVGGGYTGFAYYELTGTAGDLDDATSILDADVFTPRYYLNGLALRQKIPYVLLKIDPVATEQITVQYRLDDQTTWSDPSGSPYTASGTDEQIIVVPIKAVARRIQLRFRNNRADEVYNIHAVGLPALALQPAIA